MKIYNYSPNNGELLSESEARLDPIDKLPMIPANATPIIPPTTGQKQIARFLNGGWGVVEDNRGYKGYDNNREPVEITKIGVAVKPDWTTPDPRPLTTAEIEQADSDAAKSELNVIDFNSIRDIREWVAKQPNAPSTLKDREAQAIIVRGRVKSNL